MITETMLDVPPPCTFWVWHAACRGAVQMVQQYAGCNYYVGQCRFCQTDLSGFPELYDEHGRPVA